MSQEFLLLSIVGRPPSGKSRREIVRESQARRRRKQGGTTLSLQVPKRLHRKLKLMAAGNNCTLTTFLLKQLTDISSK